MGTARFATRTGPGALTIETFSEAQLAEQAANRAAATRNAQAIPDPSGLGFTIAAWIAGGIVVALLTTVMWTAGRIEKDCNVVTGAGGQQLNVCVDANGNISDGDR